MSSKRKSNTNLDDESESSKKRSRPSNRNKENVQPNNKPCSSNSAAALGDSQTQSGASQNSQSLPRSIPNNQLGLYLNSQE